MKVTLLTGRVVEIGALKMGQLRRMTEKVTAGSALDATVNACVDAMNNGRTHDSTPLTAAWFEDEFTVAEANELFAKVAEVSGITLGEAVTIQ